MLIAVNHATGTVTRTVFHTTEGTSGYPMLFEGLIYQQGVPLAIDSGRNTSFKYNARQMRVPVDTTRFGSIPVGGRIVR